jgi:Rrf2 family protein
MLFSTKAEYGVRLMVELGRQAGDGEHVPPVSLGAVAEAETLPLSYLEHLVAKLRDAGLVTSVRGAHGGYRLARPAEEIAMLEVVQALEGPIAPMECFHELREGRVLCSHEADGSGRRHGCPVEDDPRGAGRVRRRARRPRARGRSLGAPLPELETNWPIWRYATCT